MQLSARVPSIGSSIERSLPSLVETLLTLAVVAMLLPLFTRVADVGTGRDQRFAAVGYVVSGLPPLSLPTVCGAYGALAEPAVRERLCGNVSTGSRTLRTTRVPLVLSDVLAQANRAFLGPVKKVEDKLRELRLQQREGIGELRGISDAIASLEAESRPFVEHFQLTGTDEDRGPAPLSCAARAVQAALTESVDAAPADAVADIAGANAVLLLAAALDGHAATQALAGSAQLPIMSDRASPACAAHDLPAALSAASVLMADARQSTLNMRKNEAMRALLQSAGWQWAGWMLLGLLLVKCSRRRFRPAMGVACAMLLWAAAAWIGRVPWPLASGRSFEPMRLELDEWSPPSNAMLWLVGAAALLLMLSMLTLKPRARPGPQSLSTRLGYPGLVLATGLGWLLLLDLSANGHFSNRYLALYHQGHLWLGMLCFSVLLFLRQPLARMLAWTLSIAGESAGRVESRLGSGPALLLLTLLGASAIALVGLGLSNMRQLTSELGRVWLIVGAAWFFFLRGTPLAERLARSGTSLASALRYVWPLLFVILGLLVLMLVTHDMGPLLIAGYASGAFLAASVALWWHHRSGRRLQASEAESISIMPAHHGHARNTLSLFALAVLLFVVWIAATTATLFKLGAIDEVTATRLESLAAPLASTNDQLALVSWFQRAAPPNGFGLGAVPWCGYTASGSCSGVPAQIHSDYTFAAIVGAFGSMSAWLASIGCAFWLHRLIRHHGRVTLGEPRFVSASGRMVNDGQAFLSWIAVAWVVLTLCQLAVTVAGNLAVLPLTGVTFPFVSFGMTSLLVNLGFLALCLNVDLPERGPHG